MKVMNSAANKKQGYSAKNVFIFKNICIGSAVFLIATILSSCAGSRDISLTFNSRFSEFGIKEDGTYRFSWNKRGYIWISEGTWEKISNRSIVLTSENPGLKLDYVKSNQWESQLGDNKGKLGFLISGAEHFSADYIIVDIHFASLRGRTTRRLMNQDTLIVDDLLMSYPIRVFIEVYFSDSARPSGTFRLISNEVFIQEEQKEKIIHLNLSPDWDNYGKGETPFRFISIPGDTLTYKLGKYHWSRDPYPYAFGP